MALEYQGGPSSALFCKDIDNMLPFNPHSDWNFAANDLPLKTTSSPSVTGTSVLGVTFNEGVIICADTLGANGHMAKYFNCKRVWKVNDQIVLAAGGDIADFQYLQSVIEQCVIDDECLNDGFGLKPKSLHCWLTRALYNRRSKFDPLWNVFAVGGMQDGAPYLGYVDKIGTSFESKSVASGFGAHFAQPLLRDALEKKPDLSKEEAMSLLKKCLQVLYLHDSVSLPKFTMGIVTKDGVEIQEPFSITVDWSTASFYKK